MSDPEDHCISAVVYDIGRPYKPMFRCILPAGHNGIHQYPTPSDDGPASSTRTASTEEVA